MDRTLDLRTPESITLSFELAGLGSRFLAVILDLLVQVAIAGAIVWGLSLLAAHASAHVKPGALDRYGESVAVAVVTALIFIVFFGYFILFEMLWNGQSLGKRALGIRVIRDGGYPVDFFASVIRNFVRVGEVVVGFYAISAVATLLSPENKRLGDMAAGTIVVRDGAAERAAALAPDANALAGLTLLSAHERALIARFAARRAAMAPAHRARMAAAVAAAIRPRLSRDLQALDDDTLIERLSGW